MVAMWVTLDRRHVLVMFTFAVVESFVEDHAPISILIALIAFSQLISNLSRLPFRYIPCSLKGSVSQVTLVSLLISGESIALPNSAYLVLETLVFKPDSSLKFSRILRTSRSWVWGLQNFKNMLMSSAYASIIFLWFWEVVQGRIFFEWDSFRSSNSMQILNRYPAIGSPCLHPLPTFIRGVGKPLIRMEDWKSLRRIPNSLKGSVTQVIFVSLLIMRESTALPKRAYLVLETFVFKPDSCLNLSRISRASRSWDSGLHNCMKRFISSA